MNELLSELIGKPVCLLLTSGHMETGILRGVGCGLICVDLPADNEERVTGPPWVRAFFVQTSVEALRGVDRTVNDGTA